MPFAPVLLYDGGCSFCSGVVQFILRRDRRRTLRFAALDGAFARRALTAFPELAGVDSVVWLEEGSGCALVRSDAVFQIARYLGGAWRLIALGAMVPRALRNRLYDLVARHRHRLVPPLAQCFVPAPEVLHRFL